MKKEYGRWLLLSGVLLFYAFLYIATTKKRMPYDCDDECEKLRKVDSLILLKYPQTYTYKCNTAMFCINITDTVQIPRQGLADTACMYLKDQGLLNLSVSVVANAGRDTLLKQTCP
jgi:hypothetical protein